MTLLKTIQDLRASADAANDEHRVKMRTGRFAELSARLSPALKDLPSLIVALAELNQLDIEMPPELRQAATQAVESLHSSAVELPATPIGQSLDFANGSVRSVEKYIKDLRSLITGIWQELVSEPLPAINSDLVDALANGGVDVEEIRGDLESAEGRILVLRNTTLPTEGAVRRYQAATAAIHRCGELIGKVVDEDIAEGIVGCQEATGMPLSWFTPPRLKKLEGLGILDRFQVRLK